MMTPTTTGTRPETSGLDSREPCAESIVRIRLDAPVRKVAKHMTEILSRSGFEVTHRMSLSRLAEERLGVETEEVELWFLRHPLLLLQYLFTGGDPALVFPLVAILRAQGRSTYVCVYSPWSAEGMQSSGMSRQMTQHTVEKLVQAATELGASDSELMVVLQEDRS